jgi:hypothetical protein
MDKLDHYRTCVQTLLEQHSTTKTQGKDVEDILLFDTVCDHYRLMRVGWKGLTRVYHTVLHFDIKDGKIWLQQNTTDIDVGQDSLRWVFPKRILFWGCILPTNDPTRVTVSPNQGSSP